ncbi:hypothetical protein V6N13_107230 [Hibiscus sabdariffa]|uniref:Uncharacterized protein n=1 Tax=Hibiscus sabdariffa TaxID=183260 RepID=A0ABR2SPM0_9ROSI
MLAIAQRFVDVPLIVGSSTSLYRFRWGAQPSPLKVTVAWPRLLPSSPFWWGSGNPSQVRESPLAWAGK